MNIKTNIEQILNDIKLYSPHPEKVKLIAVSKYVDTDIIQEILKVYNILGENKAQILKEKSNYFLEKNQEIEWHFIGNLQKNKVKYIIDRVKLIHSINKLSLAEEIDKRAKSINKIIDVLLEINIFGEESKQGYNLDELLNEIDSLKNLKNINIIGLMTMAPLNVDEKTTRKVFSQLREIKEQLNNDFFSGTLTELSMGMSDDYKIALQEGSTLIRIGSKLYK